MAPTVSLSGKPSIDATDSFLDMGPAPVGQHRAHGLKVRREAEKMGITPGTSRLTQQLESKTWVSSKRATEIPDDVDPDADEDGWEMAEEEEMSGSEAGNDAVAMEAEAFAAEFAAAEADGGGATADGEDYADGEVEIAPAPRKQPAVGQASDAVRAAAALARANAAAAPAAAAAAKKKKAVAAAMAAAEKLPAQPTGVKWEEPALPVKPPVDAENRAALDEFELFRNHKVSETMMRDIVCRAVCQIKHGVRAPGSQADSRPFMPEHWDEEFKPTLGSYKKFLLRRCDQFRIVEGGAPGLYTIELLPLRPIAAATWADLIDAKGIVKGKGKGKGKFKGKGKGKGKDKDGDVPFGSKGVSKGNEDMIDTVTRHALAARAIGEINRCLKMPGAQADGRPAVPGNWAAIYQRSLGPFKDFVLSHPDEFRIAPNNRGSFTIAPSLTKARPPTAAARMLASAAREELGIRGVAAPTEIVEEEEVEEEEEEAEVEEEEEPAVEATQEEMEAAALAEAAAADEVDKEQGDTDVYVRPVKHGAFIRSLLSDAPAGGSKREAASREIEAGAAKKARAS
eukprot:NODE_1115_length_2601_cov_8.357720.p1 GENE.NODE_1115_length_2601_cov_8.357720~~NODE_1115_length_2601_cov_8.357720.p1  ORF type:complete len:569 (-),score=222.78 NODE_1115_length_2601_cov_8.357720:821-2527(-)